MEERLPWILYIAGVILFLSVLRWWEKREKKH